jgi:DNA-binding transcriptional regulator WhiA
MAAVMANNPRWAALSAGTNQARAGRAGRRQVALARRALGVLQEERRGSDLHVSRWVQALAHRVDHPEMTLAELGQSMTPPLTKDAYAALLRRALRKAGDPSTQDGGWSGAQATDH